MRLLRAATTMRWLPRLSPGRLALLAKGWQPGSGPAVARLFHRLLALIFLDAWLSLLVQVKTLYGSSGLLPVDEYLSLARQEGESWLRIPSLFWLNASDTALFLVCGLGIALALVALAGRAPRVCNGVNTLLYLSMVTVGRTFLMFQWDNLLLECGFWAMFLPRDRRAAWVHTIFRLILFKLYWESGLAKWQSYLHDWRDGSAMTYYYETAPLPTFLAWYAHHLPSWWHHFESWVTLAFELILPFGIFGPRPVRLFSAAFFTLFQIINASTGNYGFFCYLACCLHVFCLDDVDIERAHAWLRARLKRQPPEVVVPVELSPRRKRVELFASVVAIAAFGLISLTEGLAEFAEPSWMPRLLGVRQLYYPFRLVNTYHLFSAITRTRIEPQFETLVDGKWLEQDLKFKMGDPHRRPGYVAPHMPRVDWQLWFYGLDFEEQTPEWVVNLLDRLCNDPPAVQSLFSAQLPSQPEAVRIVFFDYHFSTSAEKRQRGDWWTRKQVAETRPMRCDPR